jgi:hypothetical protein
MGVCMCIAMFDSLESRGAYDRGMSEAHLDAVKALPSFKLTSSLDDRCCICLEGMINGSEITPLPCNHNYHNACIVQWLQRSNQCPLCKAAAIPIPLPLSPLPTRMTTTTASTSMNVAPTITVGSLSVGL